MSRPRPLIRGLATIAWLSLAVPALAGPSVPIKGNLDAVVTSQTPDPMEFALDTVADASGNVSHLGKTSAVIAFKIVPVYPFPFTGTITFKAANGDLLYAAFSGHYISPAEFTGPITFTGGTGRFAGASGTGTLDGRDIVIGDFSHFSVAIDGRIGY